MADRRDTMLLQLLTPPAPVLVAAAKAAPVKSAKPGASLTAAVRAAVQAAAILKARPAILARAPISLVGAASLRNARTVATPTPGTPPAPAFNLEAWLATAYAYWDAEDATSRTMSGADLVSVASKGTGGALLAKVTSGSAQMGTLGSRAAFANLSAPFLLSVRNAGDTADVQMSALAPVAASCFVFVIGRVDAVGCVLARDTSSWISHDISAAGVPSATYWPAGPATATWGSSISHTAPHVVAVKHGGGSLSISVDGAAFVSQPCGSVGGTNAARIIASLRGAASKVAVWQVRDPADYDAGIAALKAYYSIP